MIEDVAGKPMLAKTVIVGSLKSLKNHLLENLKTRGIFGSALRENEIKWVLTIPSIWTEPAKKFMRTCAVKVNE